MPQILFSKSDEEYLQKCATEQGIAYGLIIGQRVQLDKFIVAHLAKNCEEEDLEDANAVDLSLPTANGHAKTPNANDINTQALTSQWLSANKMIPGSFNILGVFIASTDKDICKENNFGDAKNVLYDVHNLLAHATSLYRCLAADHENSEYVFMTYCSENRKAVCKLYTHSNNGGSFSAMDSKFVEKPFEWHCFECSYELEEVFPIVDTTQKINIEDQFRNTVEVVKANLAAGEIFIENENVDDRMVLDAYIKEQANNSRIQTAKSSADMIHKAFIFLPVKCQISATHPIRVKRFNGTIRYQGIISSRIWCNPKCTMADVKKFIRNDILRSLLARIQVYCDGLTEPNISTDAIFISEPPRRVYFSLPASKEQPLVLPIQFSEYIFRGEAATVAVAQAKQVLDLDITSKCILADIESLPDEDTLSNEPSENDFSSNSKSQFGSMELSRKMYMLGIAVALLVLVISILMHFIFSK